MLRHLGILPIRVANPSDYSDIAGVAANRQVVNISDPFTVPFGEDAGATAMHPGGFNVPSQDINCRCTTIPVIETPKSAAAQERYTKIFTQQQRAWERSALRVLKRGFKTQRDELLAALAEHFRGIS